jgi:hypothetical protein
MFLLPISYFKMAKIQKQFYLKSFERVKLVKKAIVFTVKNEKNLNSKNTIEAHWMFLK